VLGLEKKVEGRKVKGKKEEREIVESNFFF
jgi:hypothetical protein